MKKIKKTIRAGGLTKTIIYTPATRWDTHKQRAEKRFATTEAQKLMNLKTAREKMMFTIAANFTATDCVITLTYDNEHYPDNYRTAKNEVRKFIRRLRTALRRKGRTLKYIYTTEGKHGDSRLHHHIICNVSQKESELIESLWWNGTVNEVVSIKRDVNGAECYEALAKYITKESMDGKPLDARMFVSSRNLKCPVVKTEWVGNNEKVSTPVGCLQLEHDAREKGFGGYSYVMFYIPSWLRNTDYIKNILKI